MSTPDGETPSPFKEAPATAESATPSSSSSSSSQHQYVPLMPRPAPEGEAKATATVTSQGNPNIINSQPNSPVSLVPLLPRPSSGGVAAATTNNTASHSTSKNTARSSTSKNSGAGSHNSSGRGRGGGRDVKRRGPGRPPKSDRQGPPAHHRHSSSSAAAISDRKSQIRRGPGRPKGPGRPPGPGKRKRLESAIANSAGNAISSSGTAALTNAANATTTTTVSTTGEQLPAATKTKRKYTKKIKQNHDENSFMEDHEDHVESATISSKASNTAAITTAAAATAGYETDPETTLDFSQHKVSTVHWDPSEGMRIGWKARLLTGPAVLNGRITQYDPYTHQHKIRLDDYDNDDDIFEEAAIQQQLQQTTKSGKKKRKHKKPTFEWLRLYHSDVQMATRLVWAHVKGYAWWPAMVMELSSPAISSMASPRDGYVFVHFIGAPEVATLRDSPDCIRPFSSLVKDPVIEKSKKKRNIKAIAQAQREELNLQHFKNQAARHYARKAFAMADPATCYVGKRVKLFSSDINYPDGATVIGTVRQYSSFQKKWLVNFETSYKIKHKVSAAWINLQSKDCSLTLLQEDSNKPRRKSDEDVDPTDTDLVPFLFGFSYRITERQKLPTKKGKGAVKDDAANNDNKTSTERDEIELQMESDAVLSQILKERCCGCVDVWSGDYSVNCIDCGGSYHLGCVDPPISTETFQRMDRDEKGNVKGWRCPKCTLCLGCYQKDIVFGSHPIHPIPPTVSLPLGESLNLCSMCVKAYDAEKYCPNCAHSWDDIKYEKILEQLEEEGVGPPEEPMPSKKLKKDSSDSSDAEASSGVVTRAKGMPPNTPFASGTLMNGARVDMSWYHAENNVWGYTEGDMLLCDSCQLWIHAGCGGLSQSEYEMTSEGNHPIYSKEFLCRVCCRKRCIDLIERMQQEDLMMLFAVPVTEKVAPNYHDVIKRPMDLQTMMTKAKEEEYLNYAWVREDFALMVFNALTFNRFYTKFWNEAKRFYEDCLKVCFSDNMLGKAAPPTKYDEAVEKNFVAAEAARQMEEERIQHDELAEKKDLVAGAEVAKVTLPPLRQKPPDDASCLPYQEVKVKPLDAYYYAWMDCCFTCGSSGASDTMIFCVDCGEAFHSFCANVPIHSMDIHSVAGWRCPNCKVCEVSGDVPIDELRMIFCETCDRAFSLDLLDPPLKKAPPGLWICGQCVDCKVCKNTSEPPRPAGKNDATSAISLKYWSRDPEKCYRCGGCDGLSDLILGEKLECQACKKVMRNDDGNFVRCSECKACVHGGCDRRADDFMKMLRTEELFGSRTMKHQKTKPKYRCPPCSGLQLITKMDFSSLDTSNKAHMHEQAWQTIVQGGFQGENYSPIELHRRLLDQLEWQTREMWRDEYVSVVEEAIRFYRLAKSSFGDPRKKVVQNIIGGIASGKITLPKWLGQRAYRFLVLLKRHKWDTAGFTPRNIESCVFSAKLGAAFLAVCCHTMNLDMKKNVKTYSRVERLLKSPLSTGVFEIPMDRVRNQEKLNQKLAGEQSSKQLVDKAILRPVVNAKTPNKTFLALPLCGWGRHIDPSSIENAWRDPRECCLCHICGDNDAGFPEPEDEETNSQPTIAPSGKNVDAADTASSAPERPSASSENESGAVTTGLPPFVRLGRLLPMADGQFVHASCALWSSEVWESPRGGLINAMEKARSRGAKLKCFGCGRAGATVGCNKQNCSFNYHFPCAKACGAVFTSKQQMFCANHKDNYQADGTVVRESFEAMKTLIVAPEKQKPILGGDKETEPKELCLRVGSLVVHSLGKIVQDVDGFHVEDYIFTEGYVATRIFWSMTTPRTRTVYILKIERNINNDGTTGPLFTITPGDAPSSKIRGKFVSQVYKTLVERVRKANADYFSQGDMFSKLPMIRKTRKKFFALNGPQFFGIGLNQIRERIESLPGVEAVVAPLKPTSPKYRFCFVNPNIDVVVDLQRKRAAVAAERALENSTGCARTEGSLAITRSGGSGRITRALVRSVEEEGVDEVINNSASNSQNRRKNVDPEKNKLDKKRHQAKYNKMKSVPMEDRLVARRSHIHGWGLFTKLDIKRDDMITEYMGEIVRQSIADKREAAYEISGEGSCYMFRLDMQRIVDATVIGCMARFMNHCCQPNAYAKIITVDTEFGVDKKIAVFANRDIAAGEEITYDYKFPVEDGSLRCTCGAPNCIGRMN